jgi:hypothetical protein
LTGWHVEEEDEIRIGSSKKQILITIGMCKNMMTKRVANEESSKV